jgi:hypothetical protein
MNCSTLGMTRAEELGRGQTTMTLEYLKPMLGAPQAMLQVGLRHMTFSSMPPQMGYLLQPPQMGYLLQLLMLVVLH